MVQGRHLAQFSIGAKVTTSLLLMVLLLGVVGAITFYDARRASERFEGVRAVNERAMTVLEVDRAVAALQRDVLHYTYSGHRSIADTVRQRSAQLEQHLMKVRSLCSTEEERAFVLRLEGHLAEYDKTFEQAVEERELRRELVYQAAASTMSKFDDALLSAAARPELLDAGARLALEKAMKEAEVALFKYLHHPRFALLTGAERAVQNAARRYAIDGANPTGQYPELRYAEQYLGVFTRIVQATRSYLHLTGVVMAGEAMEFGHVSTELRELILNEVDPISEEFSRRAVQTQLRVVVVGFAALAAAGIIAWLLTRNLSGPISAIARTLTELSEDRAADIPATDRVDEIGQMAKAADVFRRRNLETKALLERARHLTAELARNQRQLEKSNAELEQFVYTVSHDLKSPVVTSSGFLGMIRRLADQGRIEEALSKLDTIESANRRMANLIDDLLDLSRVGRIDLEVTTFDPSPLLEEWKRANQMRLEQAGFELIIESLPNVSANPSRFMQVMDNLLTNAMKYGRASADTSTITVEGHRDGAESIVVVKDRGPGVAPEFHERMFALFQRLDNTQAGTGVGLAIVEKVMRSHGGRVWVQSRGEGDGCAFHLSFPDTSPRGIPATSSTSGSQNKQVSLSA